DESALEPPSFEGVLSESQTGQLRTEESQPDPAQIENEQAAGPVPLLPRRTPQVPDVPEFALFANDPLLDPSAPPADGADFTRSGTHLSTPGGETEVKDGFDFADVLQAVKAVAYVRDAQLRWNAGAGQTLRIEFADGADEAEVTRAVVRLLRAKMGL